MSRSVFSLLCNKKALDIILYVKLIIDAFVQAVN